MQWPLQAVVLQSLGQEIRKALSSQYRGRAAQFLWHERLSLQEAHCQSGSGFCDTFAETISNEQIMGTDLVSGSVQQ